MVLKPSKLAQQAREIRRGRLIELMCQGYRNQSEIAQILNVSRPTISKDIKYFREQSQRNLESWITSQIPMALTESLTFFDMLMRKCSVMLNGISDSEYKTKLSVINTMKELQIARTQVISDATIAKELLHIWKQKQDSIMSSLYNDTITTTAADADTDTDTTAVEEDIEEQEEESEIVVAETEKKE